MENEENEENEKIYNCIHCHFKCSYTSDWNRHINTRKHLVSVNGNKLEIKFGDKNETFGIHQCTNCNKIYKSLSGLWKHKQKCNEILCKDNTQTNISIEPTDKELIMMLIKENSELKNMMMEVIKNGTHNNNNNTINNSNNKSFNLNFFLNETCKYAMNIMDFVDSIKIQLSDLENVGKIGYVEGISNIIVKNLNSLDETKRPVHCTDTKREVMYVKDEDKWEKENQTNVKLRKAIKKVAQKNTKMLSEFRIKNPDCLKSTSKVSDQYNKLVFEAMGGKGDNDLEKEDKIIKNIAKKVTIDK
jgi:hypothetical protein